MLKRLGRIGISALLVTMILTTNVNAVSKTSKNTDPKIIDSQIKCISILWKQECNIKKNKWIKVDLNGDKKLEEIQIGMDTPNGTKVSTYFKNWNRAYNLMYDCSIGKEGMLFNNGGDLKKNYYIQVSFVDFDNDKKPEIVISAGDNLIEIQVSILKFTGKKDKPYKQIGFIEGQKRIIITKNKTIEVPYGSQGLFDEYKFSKGKFIRKE